MSGSNIMPTISEMKRTARAVIKQNFPMCIIVCVVFLALQYAITLLLPVLGGFNAALAQYQAAMQEQLASGYNAGSGFGTGLIADIYRDSVNLAGILLEFLIGVVKAVISTCLTWYFLRMVRDEKLGIDGIMSGFLRFTPLFILNLLIQIFTGLWTLLFVIPGIIAALRYSQAAFLMFDNPQFSAMHCIRESKYLMRGYKLDFFILGLSFIGWYLLGMVVTYFTGYDFLQLWILPYTTMTNAIFYNALRNVNPPLPPVQDSLPPLY